MGFLDCFRPPNPDRFAKMACRLLRKSGVSGPIRYDSELFVLSFGSPEVQLGLRNAFAEYCRAPRFKRGRILPHYIATMSKLPSLPDDFSQARSMLLPRVRSRFFYERIRLEMAKDDPDHEIPFKPLAEHLGVDVVIDTPDTSAIVNRGMLGDWGISLDEALAVARDNLWAISNEDFIQLSPGLYAPGREDTYDAARLFLHDLIWQLPVKGEHIAMIPHRNLLLVCGSEDAEALSAMSRVALEALQDSRAETGTPVILKGSQWTTAHPTANFLAPLRSIHVQSMAAEYSEQKHLLERQPATDETPFTSSVILTQNQATGELRSVTVWGDGVKTLLPRADDVAFVRQPPGSAEPESVTAAWEDVQRTCGALMEAQDMYPPRWLVERFPSQEQLNALPASR